LRPACSIRRPAKSPGGFLNMHPEQRSPIGCWSRSASLCGSDTPGTWWSTRR
jgi:hypothetical protein